MLKASCPSCKSEIEVDDDVIECSRCGLVAKVLSRKPLELQQVELQTFYENKPEEQLKLVDLSEKETITLQSALKKGSKIAKVSKAFYLSAPIFCLLLGVVLALSSGVRIPPVRFKDRNMLLRAMVIPALLNAVITLTLFYKAWSSIQDGHARTTPRRAIGFLFIPIFNLYWVFQFFGGFAIDYNRFLDRYSINAKKLSEWTFLLYPILIILSWLIPLVPLLSLLLVIIFFTIISNTCDAINSIQEPKAQFVKDQEPKKTPNTSSSLKHKQL